MLLPHMRYRQPTNFRIGMTTLWVPGSDNLFGAGLAPQEDTELSLSLDNAS